MAPRAWLLEPVDVIAVVAPWNYPYLTAVNAVLPALIAGNAVVLNGGTISTNTASAQAGGDVTLVPDAKAGQIAVFLGSWYSQPILERVLGNLKPRRFEQSLARINALERTLADEGTLFIKLWLHVSKKVQRKRLKAEEHERSTRFLVTKSNWKHRVVNFLLDTNVVSEAMRKRPSARVLNWIAAQIEESLFISAITLGELRRGSLVLGDGKKRKALLRWIEAQLGAAPAPARDCRPTDAARSARSVAAPGKARV